MEKLLCPYCGGEMRRGWLRSRRSDIWWEPDPAASSDEEMRCIAGAAGFSGAEAEAWDCPACKKLVLDRSRRNLPLGCHTNGAQRRMRKATASRWLFSCGLASNGQTC